ncbi:MAG: hypothetical protein ACI4Q4_04155 [Oscillospiraceae bacterium]
MTIDRIFDSLQTEDGCNPFDTDESSAAIEAILSRVEPKDQSFSADFMGFIVDERRRAFREGFKAACSLLVEGLGREG